MTTKEQERKALEQIKKIVKGLGENSYVATAFEGCFKDAEENIEYDFAMSMKDRWENAERKASSFENKICLMQETIDRLQHQRDLYEQQYNQSMKDHMAEITAIKRRTLTPDDLEVISVIVRDNINQAETDAKEAAEGIVKCAEIPDSNEFKASVRKHREAEKISSQLKALQSRVEAASRQNFCG